MEISTRCKITLFIVDILGRIEKWLVISAEGEETLIAKVYENFTLEDSVSEKTVLPERSEKVTKTVSLLDFKYALLGMENTLGGMRKTVFASLPVE